MTRGRNTTVIAIRITDTEKTILNKRANKKGLLISDYIKWVLFRLHIKKDGK